MKAKRRINPETTTIDCEKGTDKLDLFTKLIKPREETKETSTRIEQALEKNVKAAIADAYPAGIIAEKIEAAGVTKSKQNTLSTILLGILAGVFIGFGAMLCTVATTHSGLGFGLTKLVGGLTFCIGLILVVIAGAELFTGNTLMIMSWMSGRIRFSSVLRNWGIVYFANLAGAISLVGLMYYTSQWTMDGNGAGANALLIANSKVNLTFGSALVRGILCNALVCLAVWLCYGARTVTDKIVAVIFPVTAFVAAGFEHSIANMYFIPMGILLSGQPAVLSAAGVSADSLANLSWAGFLNNLIPVTIGNIIGGSILIGAVYWMAYLRGERKAELVQARPWLKTIFPDRPCGRAEEKSPVSLTRTVSLQIEELIRAKMEKPALIDRGGKALLAVLAKAKDDENYLAGLTENPADALKDFDLTSEEKAALLSGDIRWIESKLGILNDPLRTWLFARLSQEKW